MATRNVSQRLQNYGVIQRGTSLTIPVTIKTPYGTPIDLTGLSVSFTVKREQEDFDRDDTYAYIKKDFVPQEPKEGRFLILLTSEDTDFETGRYYFDVQLTNVLGMVHRLTVLEFELKGGPTNRNVNPDFGQMAIGDEITIMNIVQGTPIVILAPLIAWSPSSYAALDDLVKRFEGQEKEIETLKERIKEIEEELNGP